MSVNISFIKNLSCRHLEDTGQMLMTDIWSLKTFQLKWEEDTYFLICQNQDHIHNSHNIEDDFSDFIDDY